MTLLSSVEAIEETPVDRYLSAQADLTAVERFAQRHEAELVPRQARYYRDLIPLARPEPGQQYGFAVDLDACTGCKACVSACHSLNGLDDGESWRSVTVLPDTRQTVTAACHHCLDPACLKGCPVDAYEKDPVTGIVVHLDDQCIGCGYCTLTCPYDVPVYNKARGIVRKCDMCQGRLAAGEAPACVQACPNNAISVSLVDTAAVASELTAPTTVYRSARRGTVEGPAVVAPSASHTSHTPLVVMLVLTQLSVGAFIVGGTPLAVPAGVLALGASVLHLGRPQYAYRAVIGLRHSWLSREVVAFGGFTGLALVHALWPRPWLAVSAAAMGLAGVGCSVMVYAVTGRRSWRAPLVALEFVRTTATCGVATVLWASAIARAPLSVPTLGLTLVLAAVVGAELRDRMSFFTRP